MKKTLIVVALALLVTGCADTVTSLGSSDIGFWHGLWHGWILPVSWIVSLFDEDVAVYAVNNIGGWYDFGFVIGTGSGITLFNKTTS